MERALSAVHASPKIEFRCEVEIRWREGSENRSLNFSNKRESRGFTGLRHRNRCPAATSSQGEVKYEEQFSTRMFESAVLLCADCQVHLRAVAELPDAWRTAPARRQTESFRARSSKGWQTFIVRGLDGRQGRLQVHQ
jgi:hypothetical protein